jgi:hypothetical protein
MLKRAMTKFAWRVSAGVALGLAVVAACAGTAPALDAQGEETARRAAAAASDVDAAPRCPYGALEDPQRGFVRCLTPDERDAGWPAPGPQKEALPKEEPPPPKEAPQPEPPPPPKEPAPAATAPPPSVEVGTPKFENGQVPKAEKFLHGLSNEIAKCVSQHGGLSGGTGSMKVQFLVRARGRAEGVEVLSAKGVAPEAQTCVRVLLKNRAIGAPSADPVGVTVTLTFKPKG